MSYKPSISTWQTTGTINSLNGTVELDAPGSSSAIISVSGTFVGSLTFTGSGATVAENGIQGGRLAFKSGVGSLGTNVIDIKGTSVNNEYRIVTGGKSIRVKMTSYTSGTATVKITASAEASTVFINGPVHDAFEEAVRAGRAFSAGTGFQAITGSNYLKYRFANPANSGVNAFVTIRRTVTATTTEFLNSQLVINPSAITTPTVVTPSNLKTGGVSSLIEFTTKLEATALTGGIITGGLPIPLNGIPLNIEVIRLVQPGEVFGYQIQGAGGPLSQSVSCGVAVIWYEENIN
jgi:predicted secreted protein